MRSLQTASGNAISLEMVLVYVRKHIPWETRGYLKEHDGENNTLSFHVSEPASLSALSALESVCPPASSHMETQISSPEMSVLVPAKPPSGRLLTRDQHFHTCLPIPVTRTPCPS